MPSADGHHHITVGSKGVEQLSWKDKLAADAQGRAERAAEAVTLHDDGGTGDDDSDPAEAGNVSVKVGIETSCNDVNLESLQNVTEEAVVANQAIGWIKS